MQRMQHDFQAMVQQGAIYTAEIEGNAVQAVSFNSFKEEKNHHQAKKVNQRLIATAFGAFPDSKNH